MKNHIANLLLVLTFGAPLNVLAAGSFCGVRVDAVGSGLNIVPEGCLSASTQEFKEKLTGALVNHRASYSWASLSGPLTPQNLTDMSAAWKATCKKPSGNSFVKHYARSDTATAILSAFASHGRIVVLDSVDNFYVVNPRSMRGAIDFKGCKNALLMPVLYFKVIGLTTQSRGPPWKH